MPNYFDRVKTEAATGSGTGNVTFTAAAAQCALPPAGINQTATYTLLDSGGVAWECGQGTLAESGGTYSLTRGGSQVVHASSNSGSAISLTNSSAHTLFLTADAHALSRLDLRKVATTLTTGDLTATLNTEHRLTISGLTAARNFILPAGAFEGDRIKVRATTNAPATIGYELIIKGDTGVTLTHKGVDYTAAEFTRLFIADEAIEFEWNATASKWLVLKDERIAQSVKLTLTTPATTNSAWSWTVPTSASGAFTTTYDNAHLAIPASSRFAVRRNCKVLQFARTVKNGLATGQYSGPKLRNVTTSEDLMLAWVSPGGGGDFSYRAQEVRYLNAGNLIEFSFYGNVKNQGCSGGDFGFEELLR